MVQAEAGPKSDHAACNAPRPPRTGRNHFDVQVQQLGDARGANGGLVLIERQFPGGLAIDFPLRNVWCPKLAPSSELLRWFDFERGRWGEFCRRYSRELEGERPACERLRQQATDSRLTLLYCHGRPTLNAAAGLKLHLERLECESRWSAGWIVGGYSFPIREEIELRGGLWFAPHKAWVMPDRQAWDEVQSLLPGEF